MKILDRLPYSVQPTTISVRGESVRVRPHQIMMWISISLADLLEWDPRTPLLPAVLDTGNNFTLSIHPSHLIRWAGMRPELLRVLGGVRFGDTQLVRRDADVWVHPNISGRREPKAGREPFRLNLHDGIAVYSDEAQSPPHLPLLGLRALTENKLRTAIDGERREVTMRTGWRLLSFS